MAEKTEAAPLLRDVATFELGETQVNTLLVGLGDVVVPVELDPDADPLQDDAVRLASVGGAYDRTLCPADEEDVEVDRDNRRLYYRFRAVPFGAYRAWMKVAGEWADLYTDLVVRQGGATCGGKKLEAKRPEKAPAPPVPPPDPDVEEDDEPPEDLGYADQMEPVE